MRTSPNLLAGLLLFVGLHSAFAATSSLNPISDAFTTTGPSGNLSGNNYGKAGALGVAASGLPKGEFQSAIQFDLSSTRNAFNAQYGTGLWGVQSVTLQLTATPSNNAVFNGTAAGRFNISLMVNNSWTEGTGSPSAPTTDGIWYTSLQNTYINNSLDQDLGTFTFTGNTSGANTYILNLTPQLIADLNSGADLSLRFSAADSSVSYLFNSRDFGTAGSRPLLTITAVPEPGAFALGAMGLALLGVWKRTRKNSG